MNAYTCPACKGVSYSSARLEDIADPRCPYCGHDPLHKCHRVFGYLAALCFVAMLGCVGAVDLERMGVIAGYASATVFLGLTTLFAWLSGAIT